jgi:PhnB protein
MPQLNAYLSFNGQCADAMRFYESALGGKVGMMLTYGESPMADQVPPGVGKLIMHSQLTLDQGVLMAADQIEGNPNCPPYEGMKGFSLTLTYPTADEARKAYDALSAGGKISMPLQKMFWAEAFASFTDKFGTPWVINGGMLA